MNNGSWYVEEEAVTEAAVTLGKQEVTEETASETVQAAEATLTTKPTKKKAGNYRKARMTS